MYAVYCLGKVAGVNQAMVPESIKTEEEARRFGAALYGVPANEVIVIDLDSFSDD